MPLHVLVLFLFLVTTISLPPPPTLSLSTSSPPPPRRSLPLVAPIRKDNTTLRYTLSVYLKTPPQRLDLLLHLGGRFFWVDCYSNYYSSSTYRHIHCNSSICVPLDALGCGYCSGNPPSPTCSNDTCLYLPENPLILKVGLEDALVDALGLPSTDGSSAGRVENLSYTPILLNPHGDTFVVYAPKPAAEYYVNVTAIKVNGKAVPLNATLLAIDQKSGHGGTIISTLVPYTTLQTSIYGAVARAFAQEASTAFNLTATQPVKPFGLCYSARLVNITRAGPAVPAIDLVMHGQDAVWRLFGANSMVRIQRNGTDAWCLGLVDGGAEFRAAILIGGHQMEDNLLQFDLGKMRLGFSSSVLVRGTTCANFDFTTGNHV
ncbi:hypothetical protein EUGRSUZ_H01514 [Eucalyptus grandis]|uniref:Uncharacterized protein n=1 Tax=Eucalyptus grandis TaxID=71139 RepID=A0ACC3JNW6_EUCGR|nr:hypothetical protein EUGRSUZ_H01514 [Eucalyptus grandis]